MRIWAILLSTLFIFIIRGEVSHAINVKLDDRLQLVGNQNGKIIVGFKPEAEHRTQPKPFQWQQLFGLVPQASHTQTHKSSLKPEHDKTPTPNGNSGPTVTGTAALPQSVTDVAPVIGPVIEPTAPVTNVMPIPAVDISPVAEPVIQPTVQATNVIPTPKTDVSQVIGAMIQTPVKGSNRAPMTGNGRPTTPENDVSPVVGPVIQPTVTGTAALPQPVADVAPVIGPAIQTPVKGSDRAPMTGNDRPTTPKTDSSPASGPVIPPTNVMPIPAADISPVAEPVIQPTVQATNVMPMPETGVPQVIGAPVVEPVIQPTVLETNVMPIPAADVSPVAGPVIPPTVQGPNVMPLPEAVIQTPVQVTDRTPNADRMLMTGNDRPTSFGTVETPVIAPVLQPMTPGSNVIPMTGNDQTLTMGNSRPLMIGNDRPTKVGTDVSSVIGPLIQTPVQGTVLTPIMKNNEPTMSGTDGTGIRPVLPSTILETNSMPMTEPVIQPTIPITNGMLPPVIEVSPVRGPVIQPTVQGTDRTPMTGNFRPTMPGTVELPRLESVIQPTVPGNDRPIMPNTEEITMGGLSLQPQPRSRLSQLLRLQQVLRLQQQLQPKPEPKLQFLPGAEEIQMPGPVIQTPVQVTDRNPMFGADRMLITGKDRPTTGTVESPLIGPLIQPVTNVMPIPGNDRPIMPETEEMTIGGFSLQPQPLSRLQQLLELQQLLQPKQEPSLQLLPEPAIQPTVPGNDLPIMPNTEGMTMGGLSLQPQPLSRLQQLLGLQQLLQPKSEPKLQLLPEPVIQPTPPIANVMPQPAADISPLIGPVIQPTVPVTNVMPKTGNDGMTMNRLALQPQPRSRLQQLLGLQQILRLQQQLQPKPEPKLQLSPAVLLSSILKSASQSESNAVSQPKSSLNLQSIIKPQFSLGPKFPVPMQPKINDNANFGINPIQTSMVNPLLPTVLQVLKQLSQLICNGVGRNEILSGNSALNGGLSVLCDENLWSAPAFTSQANRVISLLQNRLPKFGVKI